MSKWVVSGVGTYGVADNGRGGVSVGFHDGGAVWGGGRRRVDWY